MGLKNSGVGVKEGGAHFVKRIKFTEYARIQSNPGITITDENTRVDMDRAELSTAITDVAQNTGMWYCEIVPQHTSEHGHSIGITTAPRILHWNYAQNGAERDFTLLPSGKIMRGKRTIKGTGLSWDQGDVIQLALDFNSYYIWVGVNGTWALDKPAPVKPSLYHVALYKNSNKSVPTWLVNFGEREFTYQRPPHYAPGFGLIRRASQ